jgi:hypothetical protein
MKRRLNNLFERTKNRKGDKWKLKVNDEL